MYESICKEDTLRNHVFSLQVDHQVRLKVNRCADVHVVAFADWFPTQMVIGGADLRVDSHAAWNPDWDICMCVRRSRKQAVRKRKSGGKKLLEHQMVHSAREHSDTLIGCQ